MEQPAAAGDHQDQRQPEAGGAEALGAVELQRIEGAAGYVGDREQHDLGADQQRDGAQEDAALALHLQPEVAVEVDYGAGSQDAGLEGITHVR